MTMEITKFSEKDMNAAISMARQTWHGYYDVSLYIYGSPT